MSDLAYLDDISNKELHAKCLQYGLPNIPVTDSSRQVILRRLRSAILGVPMNKSKNAAAAAKKTPRRETIHSSKTTPASAEIKVNRVAGKSPTRNNNNNANRRTIAATPSHYNPLENSSVRSVQTTTTVSDVGSQSEDDDYYLNKSPSYKSAAQREDTRQRRSVSLSKSGVLTTSYTREVQQPHHEEVEVEQDQPQSYTYQRPHVVPNPASAHTMPRYQPHIERSFNSGLARHGLTQTQLNSTSYLEDVPDYIEPPITARQAPRNTYSGSPAPFNTAGPARQRQTMGSGFARGSLIQPTFKANTLYPQLNEFITQHNNTVESMDVDTDSESEEGTRRGNPESPYNHIPMGWEYRTSDYQQTIDSVLRKFE